MRHLALLVLGALTTACTQQAPVLTSLNGVEPDEDDLITITGRDGEAVELIAEVQDPEDDPVRLWTPNAPPGFDLDPDAHVGTWLPEARATRQFLVLLEDEPDRGPVRYAQYFVTLDVRAAE